MRVFLSIFAALLIFSMTVSGTIAQLGTPRSYIQALGGTEADQFVKLIEQNPYLSAAKKDIRGPAILVISDAKSTSALDIALGNGAIVVIINSPATYSLAGVPKIDRTSSAIWSRFNEDKTTTEINSTTPVTENLTPSSVISILYGKPITWRQNFLALNNSIESHQNLMDRAAESVNQLLQTNAQQTAKVLVSVKPSDSTFTVLDDYNVWDSGSYFAEPAYESLNTVTFGSGGNDAFTQNVIGRQMTGYSGQNEYYRFDVTTDHTLQGDYTWDMGWYGYFEYCHAGPYMTNDHTYVSMDGNAYLLNYGPSTTVGSQTASVDISLSYPPGGGWGWTWNIPDVSYQTDYSSTSVTWDENYNGPNYWWPPAPWCTPPPDCTHYSFRTTRSTAWQTPLQYGITVYNAYTTFNMQIDDVYFIDSIPVYTYTTPFSYTISGPVQYCPSQI